LLRALHKTKEVNFTAGEVIEVTVAMLSITGVKQSGLLGNNFPLLYYHNDVAAR
jgi:hypothetical protein